MEPYQYLMKITVYWRMIMTNKYRLMATAFEREEEEEML